MKHILIVINISGQAVKDTQLDKIDRYFERDTLNCDRRILNMYPPDAMTDEEYTDICELGTEGAVQRLLELALAKVEEILESLRILGLVLLIPNGEDEWHFSHSFLNEFYGYSCQKLMICDYQGC